MKLEEYIVHIYEQAEKQRGKLKPEDVPADAAQQGFQCPATTEFLRSDYVLRAVRLFH